MVKTAGRFLGGAVSPKTAIRVRSTKTQWCFTPTDDDGGFGETALPVGQATEDVFRNADSLLHHVQVEAFVGRVEVVLRKKQAK